MRQKRTIFFHNESKGDGVYRRLPVRFLLLTLFCMVTISISGVLYFSGSMSPIKMNQIKLEEIQRQNEKLEAIVADLQEQNQSIEVILAELGGKKESMTALVSDSVTKSTTPQEDSGIDTVIDDFSLALIQSYTDTLSSFLFDISTASSGNKNIWSEIPVTLPVSDPTMTISSRFGETIENFTGIDKTNDGIDFAVVAGATVSVTANGTVEKVERSNYWGKKVTVRHSNGIKTVYAHLESISVSSGKRLKKGDTIGVVGTTRWSVGPKLHYEIHKKGIPINPEILIIPNSSYHEL